MCTIIALFIASFVLYLTRNLNLFYNTRMGKWPKYVCIAVVLVGVAIDVILRINSYK